MTDKMLTTAEISKFLGVHYTTVGRWIDKGELKAFTTLGKHRRVMSKDLVDFLNATGMPIPETLIGQTKVKILVADDDESVLDVISNGLKRNRTDIEVYSVSTGFEAGQIVGSHKPDIIILDIMLPDIDGFKVCELIKRDNNKIKVIAITGYGTEEVKKKIMAAGADIYIEKPFDIEYLIQETEKITAGAGKEY